MMSKSGTKQVDPVDEEAARKFDRMFVTLASSIDGTATSAKGKLFGSKSGTYQDLINIHSGVAIKDKKSLAALVDEESRISPVTKKDIPRTFTMHPLSTRLWVDYVISLNKRAELTIENKEIKGTLTCPGIFRPT